METLDCPNKPSITTPYRGITQSATHRYLIINNVLKGQVYSFQTPLLQPQDFQPAFKKYADDHGLNYNDLQFVFGVPADVYTHAHSHDIITIKQVYLFRSIKTV